ncbi:MAG: hypothetical protein WBB42_02715 [Polyangiales bacterium]
MHMTTELQRRYAEKSRLQAYCLHPGSLFTHVADKGLEGTGAIEKARSALPPVEASKDAEDAGLAARLWAEAESWVGA